MGKIMIQIKDLKKHYGKNGEIKAVDGISFDCPDGQITIPIYGPGAVVARLAGGGTMPDNAILFGIIGSLLAASVAIVIALRLFNRERLLYSV